MCFAFALTLVPSSATCPSRTRPARWHSRNTWTNNPESAIRCRARNLPIVRKSGRCSAVTAMTSTRSSHARAIFRDENRPCVYAYKSSAVIIAG